MFPPQRRGHVGLTLSAECTGLMLAHRLRRWANIIPVLGYCVVATLNVGQRHRQRANINSALVQSIVPAPPAWSTD